MTQFDFSLAKAELVRHYVTLAKTPGWEAYTAARLEQLANSNPALYGDVPAMVQEALDE